MLRRLSARMRATALLLSLLCLSCASAEFEPIPPEVGKEEKWEKFDPEKAVVPIPDHERLTYSLYWKGLSAGEGVFTFHREDDTYVSKARVDTTGLLSLFHGLMIDAEATVGIADLLSRRFVFDAVEGGTERRVDIRFAESGRILSIIRKEEKLEKVGYDDFPGALDPLSAIYALRRSPLEPGRGYTTHLISEFYMYRAEAVMMRRESVKVGAGEFETLFVRADIRRRKDGVLDPTGRAAAIWFTDDDARIPVQIDAETKFGRLRLELESYVEGEEALETVEE